MLLSAKIIPCISVIMHMITTLPIVEENNFSSKKQKPVIHFKTKRKEGNDMKRTKEEV